MKTRELLFTIGVVTVAVLLARVTHSQEPTFADLNAEWIEKIQGELKQLDGQKKINAARSALFGIAGVGNAEVCESIIREIIPIELQDSERLRTISVMATGRHIQKAINSLERVGPDLKEAAILSIIRELALRGRIEEAKSLKSKLKTNQNLDRAQAFIVDHYAAARDVVAAKKAVDGILEPALKEYYLNQRIEFECNNPFHMLPDNRFLLSQVWCFIGSYQEAYKRKKYVETFVAAIEKKVSVFDAKLQELRKTIENKNGIEKFQACALLTLALIEAERFPEAKEVFKTALASSEHWKSNPFKGWSVVAVMVRLNMSDQLNKLPLVPKQWDGVGRLTGTANMLGYLKDTKSAKEFYERLKTPRHRIDFASEFLHGLSMPNETK